MRLKLKKMCGVVFLLHVVSFTWYLVTTQGSARSNAGLQRLMPTHTLTLTSTRGVRRVANVTSRVIQADGLGFRITEKRPPSEATLVKPDDCSKMVLGGLSLEEGWYPVDDVKHVYVFSAYHDVRFNGTVSIIGATSLSSVKLTCQFWKRGPTGRYASVFESAAASTRLPEGHGRRYTAVVYTCNFRKDLSPDAVSLVTKKCATPLNLLRLKQIRSDTPYRRNFTVCLTPFNYRYGKAYELVEWIELNRILGAEYFTLYNYSTASNVKKVIEYYKGQGLVEVVNWNLPMGVDTWPKTSEPVEIHYFGQIAFLNDCWRRNREFSEYLVYADLDEFIIPRDNSSTWSEMLRMIPPSNAYLFQNVFFRKEWSDPKLSFPEKEVAQELKLVTLLKTIREKQIMPHTIRSKYIIRSDSAIILGIHNVPQLRRAPGRGLTKVPAQTGLLHHYRDWEKPNETKARSRDNTIINKYKDVLLRRVKDTWVKLPDVKMHIPLV